MGTTDSKTAASNKHHNNNPHASIQVTSFHEAVPQYNDQSQQQNQYQQQHYMHSITYPTTTAPTTTTAPAAAAASTPMKTNHQKSPEATPTSAKKKKNIFGKHLLHTPKSERIPPSPPASPQANFIDPNPTSVAVVPAASAAPPSPPERFIVSQDIIGEGAFSKIRLGTSSKTGLKVAVKSLDKRRTDAQAADDLVLIRREIDLLQKLAGHPNVIKLHAAHEDDVFVHLYLQYIEGGDLYSYVCNNGRIQERASRPLFHQMLEAVDYCHRRGICHRDVKLENFLIDLRTMTVVLIDFGFATPIPHDRVFRDFPGSPAYACPSILKGVPYDGPSADVYALGIVLFTMHYSSYPFYHEDLITMCHMICDNPLKFPSGIAATEPFMDLVRWMMNKQCAQRPSIHQIRNHKWVNENAIPNAAPSPHTKKMITQMFRTTNTNSPNGRKRYRKQ